MGNNKWVPTLPAVARGRGGGVAPPPRSSGALGGGSRFPGRRRTLQKALVPMCCYACSPG
eukprot:1073594-Alexandrium_andersonii.AAC.1